MIGDCVKVQGLTKLYIKPGRMLDRLTSGIAIGVIGCCQGAKGKGVKGIGRMNMKVAKVRTALSVS